MLRSLIRIALPLVASQGIRMVIRRQVGIGLAWIAAFLLLAAAGFFGLFAAYHLLLDSGFTAAGAAAIMAGSLVLAAGAVVVVAKAVIRARSTSSSFSMPSLETKTARTASAVDRNVGRALNHMGPLGILTTAFAVGIALGRGRGKS